MTHNLKPSHGSPVPLLSSRLPPDLDSLTSFGSMRKEPRYVCLGEAKASHSLKTWAEVCSSAPHLPHRAIFQSHYVKTSSQGVMSYKETDTNPGLALLQDNTLTFTVLFRPENSFRASLWVLITPSFQSSSIGALPPIFPLRAPIDTQAAFTEHYFTVSQSSRLTNTLSGSLTGPL